MTTIELHYKTCTNCNKTLSINKFYRDRTPIHSTSYVSKCKDCYKLLQDGRKKHDPASIVSKICSICNIDKPITDFYKSYRHLDGYFKWCGICHDDKVKNKNKNSKIKRTKEYMIEYITKKKLDPVYQLKYALRSNLHGYLKKNINASKQSTTVQYLGCSLEFLKKWFDFNFSSEMNWSNRGVYWHIDHITPCDSFDLEQQSEIYKCYNWTNLRPLEKTENIRKSNKIYSDIIAMYEAKVKLFLDKIVYEKQDNIYILLPEVKTLTVNISQESGELTGNP